MREALKDPGRLEHIIAAINQIEESKEIFSTDEIMQNTVIFYGFVKLIEIIGEASYKLTKNFKDCYSEINWKQIEGMRHVLVHGYYTIEPQDVINAINLDIPTLKKQILNILSKL